VVFISILPGCGSSDNSVSEGALDPVTVSSTTSRHAETGVPIGNKLTVTFSEAMDPATINTTTFTLKQGTAAVSGTVDYSGVTAVFTPAGNLAASTVYTATITTGARTMAGKALEDNYVWSFTTGAAADTTIPTVTLSVPADAATGVPIGNKLTATFSEAMDPASISKTTFTLKQGTAAVSGTVDYSGVTAVFAPAKTLAASTVYTATIAASAKDLGGNTLAG